MSITMIILAIVTEFKGLCFRVGLFVGRADTEIRPYDDVE
jgi:hypothetical protein